MEKEGKYHLNPENLHDPELKKGEFSEAHKKMEALQEELKQVNKQLRLKRELVDNLGERLSSAKGELLKEDGDFIKRNKEDIAMLEGKAARLTADIGIYFASHLIQGEALKNIDEKTEPEN